MQLSYRGWRSYVYIVNTSTGVTGIECIMRLEFMVKKCCGRAVLLYNTSINVSPTLLVQGNTPFLAPFRPGPENPGRVALCQTSW